MKKIALLLFLCIWVLLSIAQSAKYQCGYTTAMQIRESQHPGYLEQTDKVFKLLKERATQNPQHRGGDIVYKIKVVFHVMYNTANQNLADSVILNQLAILNQDYQRQNPDTVNTRPEFKPVAGNAGIEFILADLDPQGNPTNGIHRVQSSTNFALAPFTNNVKYTAQGGTDAWDTRYYLNIWVCDMSIPGLGPAVLGFAYPLNSLANWPANSGAAAPEEEGVVIHYQAVGSNNPEVGVLDNLVDRGRTATHEVGHFLGLRHIWGDGDCTQDDGISDTPDATDNAQQACDWNKNTCTESTGAEFPDMIENYMDYAADSCMNLFTWGQIGLMRTVLEDPRADLVAWSVDIEAAQNGAQVQLSPNPTSQQLKADFQFHTMTSVRASVTNLMGQEVLPSTQTTAQRGQFVWEIQNLPSGIYFLTLRHATGSLTKKWIKL